MAEIIEKVTGTVKKTAKKVSKKATEIASATKQSVMLKTKNMELSKLLRALGASYYEFTRKEDTDTEAEAELSQAVKKVEELKAQISDLKIEIAKAKGYIPCPKCGEYTSPNKENCPKCKASLEHVTVTPKK